MPFTTQMQRSSTLAAQFLLALGALHAQAAESDATVFGAAGSSATRSMNKTKGNSSSSTTTAGGKTLAARQAERSDSGATGSVTGPQGQTAARQTTRTETGSTTTATGPAGKTQSVTVAR